MKSKKPIPKNKRREPNQTVLTRILETAEKSGDTRTVLAVVKVLEERSTMRMDAFLETSDWKEIKETLVEALRPFPEALEAASLALKKIGERKEA